MTRREIMKLHCRAQPAPEIDSADMMALERVTKRALCGGPALGRPRHLVDTTYNPMSVTCQLRPLILWRNILPVLL